MILIVADTGPINYLIQIGEIEILPRLVEKVVLPASVQTELLHEGAPPAVRKWAANPPFWVEIRSAIQTIDERDISATDRESIALARELNASFLLMDDSQARRCAARLGVKTMGTLGLLEAAASHGLLPLRATLEKLRATSCFLAEELIDAALERDDARRRQP
jgi:predicted nucleic acid-binding protein